MWLSIAQKWMRQKIPRWPTCSNGMQAWSYQTLIFCPSTPLLHTFCTSDKKMLCDMKPAVQSQPYLLALRCCVWKEIFAKCPVRQTHQKLRREGFLLQPYVLTTPASRPSLHWPKHKHLDCIGARGHEVNRSCRYSTFLEEDKENKGPSYLKPASEFKNINLDPHSTTFWQFVNWQLGIVLRNGNCILHNIIESVLHFRHLPCWLFISRAKTFPSP